jgi:hypothetical protein
VLEGHDWLVILIKLIDIIEACEVGLTTRKLHHHLTIVIDESDKAVRVCATIEASTTNMNVQTASVGIPRPSVMVGTQFIYGIP